MFALRNGARCSEKWTERQQAWYNPLRHEMEFSFVNGTRSATISASQGQPPYSLAFRSGEFFRLIVVLHIPRHS
ncbi:hypothetical protein V3C99_017165 [Haemonchus contortus]